MNDPHRDVGAPAFTASRDPADNDAGLLRRIDQGDEDAMAAFYREHGRVVFAQVLLAAGERVLAEEIVQDTMLAVWRGAGSFRGESSVRSWVIAIARRQTRVPVTTSGGTLVVIPHASPGQLQAGATIFALGHAGPDGTLSARAVAAISQVPPGLHIGVSVKDCSPSSIDEAIGAISAAPGSPTAPR